ncbi:YitT family protein [Enterococcus hirae]|nr:YitT family protein [Enterococcus hirae]
MNGLVNGKMKTAAAFVIGSFLTAFSVNCMAVPNRLGEGGIVGLTMIFYYVFHIPTFLSTAVMNAILLVIGWKLLDRKVIIRTIGSVALTTIFLKLLTNVQFPMQNSLLGAMGAGLTMGTGIGLVYSAGGTTAGSTIIAKMLQKYFGIPQSKGVLFMDLAVVIPSGLIIGMERMLLTMISVFLGSRAIAYVVEGAKPRKALTLISPKRAMIQEELRDQLNVGSTLMEAHGGYRGEAQQVLYTVVENDQVQPIIELVQAADPQAFLVIHEVQNVFGQAFDSLVPETKRIRKE